MPLIHPLQFLHGSLSCNNDTYLDELQEQLVQICGRSVSKSTIRRALQRSGYTMKVSIPLLCNLCHLFFLFEDDMCRCWKKCSKVWITSCVLAHMLTTSWSLWMKVQQIGAWHTEAMHGLSRGNMPYTRLFLFVESGEYVFYVTWLSNHLLC